MYKRDGIVYARNPTPILQVIYAEYQGNHVIRVAFNTGEIVDVDFKHGFDGPVFQPLKDENILQGFSYDHDTLEWLDGEIDVAPEYLLDVGTRIENWLWPMR